MASVDVMKFTLSENNSFYPQMFLRYVEQNKAEVFVEVQPYQAGSELLSI